MSACDSRRDVPGTNRFAHSIRACEMPKSRCSLCLSQTLERTKVTQPRQETAEIRLSSVLTRIRQVTKLYDISRSLLPLLHIRSNISMDRAVFLPSQRWVGEQTVCNLP